MSLALMRMPFVLLLLANLGFFLAFHSNAWASVRQDIERQLAHVEKKESWLSKKLSETEKKIGQISAEYDAHQKQIASLQDQRKGFEATQKILNTRLERAQKALVQSLRDCYRLDIKTGLMNKTRRSHNVEDASEIDRVTMYYHYLLSERQKNIAMVQALKYRVERKNQAVLALLQQEQALSQTLETEKRGLESQKLAQSALLQSIRQHIPSASDGLAKDHQHLRQIVEGNPVPQASRQKQAAISKTALPPFAKLRHHLPKPLIANTAAPRVRHQGVTFFAAEGSEVVAVYPGKVVFSDWLKGYGLLIIIDHGQGYMTLYAHNRSLLKHKNDWVSQGDIIAKVGHTGGISQNALYFEVRQRGQALSPTQWLG